MSFESHLLESGWVKGELPFSYVKGSWRLVFDTSSWIEVGTKNTPRIIDIPVPEERLYVWTINLIEHLCKTNEQLAIGVN